MVASGFERVAGALRATSTAARHLVLLDWAARRACCALADRTARGYRLTVVGVGGISGFSAAARARHASRCGRGRDAEHDVLHWLEFRHRDRSQRGAVVALAAARQAAIVADSRLELSGPDAARDRCECCLRRHSAVHAFGPTELNTWVAHFPYCWLAVMVASALCGHLLIARRQAHEARLLAADSRVALAA